MAQFDLLEEVSSKFVQSVVLFDKKAVYVKHVQLGDAGEFFLTVAKPNSRLHTSVNLVDPALDYKNFQIGYVNGGNYCTWWYRQPHKQWTQGLKSGQLNYKISTKGAQAHDSFGFTKPFINMLEGVYPSIESVKKLLIDQNVAAQAFHKDFALSYDHIHNDFVIEYHGTKIGASIDRELKQFKIMPEARHLIEALQEARNVHP